MDKKNLQIEEEIIYKNNMILSLFSLRELQEKCSDDLYTLFCEHIDNYMTISQMIQKNKHMYAKIFSSMKNKKDRDLLFKEAENVIPKPFLHPSIDGESAFLFVNRYPTRERTVESLRQKVLDNLHYITFDDCMEKFTPIVKNFQKKIGKEKYTIVSSKLRSEQGSEQRFAHIANEISHHKSSQYCEIYNCDIAQGKKEFMNNVVIFDDISYSGAQVLEILEYIEHYGSKEGKKITIYINVAYISALAKANIFDFFGECKWITLIFPPENLVGTTKAYHDVLTREELDIYEKAIGSGTFRKKGLTYAQRKIPDSLSFDPEIALLFKDTFTQSIANPYKNPLYNPSRTKKS